MSDSFDYPSTPDQPTPEWPTAYTTPAYTPQPPGHRRSTESNKNVLRLGTVGLVIATSILSSALTFTFTQDNNVAPPVIERTVTVQEALSQDLPTVRDTLDSIFTVAVRDVTNAATGSGVAIDEQHIVTNAHVVTMGTDKESEEVMIEVQDSENNEYEVEIVGIDAVADLAVLKVTGTKLTPLEWGDSSTLAAGDPVLALGAPLGLASTVTSGIVSAVDRPVTLAGENEKDETFVSTIQTDAAINQGNSGGALVNEEGNLVGINVAISASQGSNGSIGIGYAIPAIYAERVVNEIIANGEAQHGYLGVSARTIGSVNSLFEDGAQIAKVVKNSPADRGGLKMNDVIVSFNNIPIANAEALTAATRATAPGSEVVFTVRRNGSLTARTVAIGKAE